MGMMERNLFAEIVAGKIPADIVYEDEHCLAFRDIAPQAPVHLLIIPKKVIRTHADMSADDRALLGQMHWAAATLARQLHLTSYRLVMNCEAEAGQSVPHIHLHLLGGRTFSWPPG